jgi:hypothetical protein
MIVGLQHWHKLPASSTTDFAVQPQQLAEAVAADLQKGLIPFYFLGTIGERSSRPYLPSQRVFAAMQTCYNRQMQGGEASSALAMKRFCMVCVWG